ncbi:MAG TPA: serine/threonine-protein kinase, partial [Anaeromyxobacteraceae bacterium]
MIEDLARAPYDAFARPWERPLVPGDRVDRFEILREIGRGGFGVVYEALDPELNRKIALKTLRPGRHRHELSEEWLRREADATARLDHPAIVTVLDAGTCERGPWMALELLRGETLQARLERGRLSPREALAVALEIAAGLAHAHDRGLLHRDLKPGNVFLTEGGRVKLLDLGLAHLVGTRGGGEGGTPAYMAPEQARGGEVDARADVFALGAILFEMPAGARPFEVRADRSAALD